MNLMSRKRWHFSLNCLFFFSGIKWCYGHLGRGWKKRWPGKKQGSTTHVYSLLDITLLIKSLTNCTRASHLPCLLQQGPIGNPGVAGPLGNEGPIVSLSFMMFVDLLTWETIGWLACLSFMHFQGLVGARGPIGKRGSQGSKVNFRNLVSSYHS